MLFKTRSKAAEEAILFSSYEKYTNRTSVREEPFQ